MAPELVLRRHDGPETLTLKEPMLRVYGTSHWQPIRNDPWFREDKFWQRLVELYAPGRDFETVSGLLGDEMIGYAFGSPRDSAAPVWEPVYIFREFAVHPDHQGKGFGRQIHNELLSTRPERLACLYVRVVTEQATGAYLSWGWRKVGAEQPFVDSLVLHVMVRALTNA